MILNKRYQVIRKIGSGGMSEVFEVYDDILKINLALKAINITQKNKNEAINRFYKEYEAIAQIFHANIVRIYGIFEEFNRQFLVIELIKGYTLKERLLLYGPCTINEIIYYFKNINQAIIEAHTNDVIHRDIKPENILLSPDGKIKIVDFGVAILENTDMIEKNKIIGTSRYMAPEIIQSEYPTKKSDIYSLGIMLYELLLGATPFTAKTPALVAVKHVKELMIKPKTVLLTIPQKLENIILKATAKNTNERFSTVREFYNALQNLHQPYLIYQPLNNDEKPLKLKNILKIKNRKQRIKNKNTKLYWFLQKKYLAIFIVLLIICLLVFFGLLFTIGV